MTDPFARKHAGDAKAAEKQVQKDAAEQAKQATAKKMLEKMKPVFNDLPIYRPKDPFKIVLLAASISFAARAAPPPPDSLDAQIMAPYKDAVKGMMQPGTTVSCCSESDCRPAEYRFKSDAKSTFYEVFVRHKTRDGSGWDGGTDKWERVPESVIISPQKRIPVPTACWASYNASNNGFYCFNPGVGG